VTVELLNGKLKYTSFGHPVATLVPIGPTRFRVEGAASVYLEFETVDGKVKQVRLERDEQPKVRLVPGK
jgi:antitoxin (DNA-binding transcriptional repressor) of toxin-antitoxin stability system